MEDPWIELKSPMKLPKPWPESDLGLDWGLTPRIDYEETNPRRHWLTELPYSKEALKSPSTRVESLGLPPNPWGGRERYVPPDVGVADIVPLALSLGWTLETSIGGPMATARLYAERQEKIEEYFDENPPPGGLPLASAYAGRDPMLVQPPRTGIGVSMSRAFRSYGSYAEYMGLLQDDVPLYAGGPTVLELKALHPKLDLLSNAEIKALASLNLQGDAETFTEKMERTTTPAWWTGLAFRYFVPIAFDPVNVATYRLVAAKAASWLKRARFEAGVNMAAEAVIQPGVVATKERYGIESPPLDWLANIGIAGAAGGLIGGALGVLAKRRLARAATKVQVEVEALPPDSIPQEIRDAVGVLEDVAHTDAGNPYAGIPGGDRLYREQAGQAAMDMQMGRPIDIEHIYAGIPGDLGFPDQFTMRGVRTAYSKEPPVAAPPRQEPPPREGFDSTTATTLRWPEGKDEASTIRTVLRDAEQQPPRTGAESPDFPQDAASKPSASERFNQEVLQIEKSEIYRAMELPELERAIQNRGLSLENRAAAVRELERRKLVSPQSEAKYRKVARTVQEKGSSPGTEKLPQGVTPEMRQNAYNEADRIIAEAPDVQVPSRLLDEQSQPISAKDALARDTEAIRAIRAIRDCLIGGG